MVLMERLWEERPRRISVYEIVIVAKVIMKRINDGEERSEIRSVTKEPIGTAVSSTSTQFLHISKSLRRIQEIRSEKL